MQQRCVSIAYIVNRVFAYDLHDKALLLIKYGCGLFTCCPVARLAGFVSNTGCYSYRYAFTASIFWRY